MRSNREEENISNTFEQVLALDKPDFEIERLDPPKKQTMMGSRVTESTATDTDAMANSGIGHGITSPNSNGLFDQTLREPLRDRTSRFVN